MGLAIVGFILIGYFFAYLNVTENKIQPVSLPATISGELPITYDLRQDIDLPNELPLILLNRTDEYSEDEVFEIARSAGFDSNPIISTDTNRGTTYIWNKNNIESLVIYSRTKSIEYFIFPDNTITDRYPEEDLIDLAKNFLERKLMIDTGVLRHNRSVYLIRDETNENTQTTSQDKANLVQLIFNRDISEFKIVSLDQFSPPYSVWIEPDGDIVKIQIHRNTDAIFSDETYKIKNINDVMNSNNQATLLSLDDYEIDVFSLTIEDIKVITINQIELAYLLTDQNSSTLQPIFVLKGTTDLTGFGEVDAVLYMPAIK